MSGIVEQRPVVPMDLPGIVLPAATYVINLLNEVSLEESKCLASSSLPYRS